MSIERKSSDRRKLRAGMVFVLVVAGTALIGWGGLAAWQAVTQNNGSTATTLGVHMSNAATVNGGHAGHLHRPDVAQRLRRHLQRLGYRAGLGPQPGGLGGDHEHWNGVLDLPALARVRQGERCRPQLGLEHRHHALR